MKSVVLIFTFFLSIPFACFAQQAYLDCDLDFEKIREEIRDTDRSIVFSVIEKHAHNYTEGRNFLVFSILGSGNNKSHLIIIEEDGFFRELFIRNDSLMNMEIRESNETLMLAFDKEIYHTGTRFLGDFPEKMLSAGGNPVYFSFVDKNNNSYGESITNIFSPLIDKDVHFYLLCRALQDVIDVRERKWWHRFRFNFLRRR